MKEITKQYMLLYINGMYETLDVICPDTTEYIWHIKKLIKNVKK